MGATLIIGKGLHLMDAGDGTMEISGAPIDSTNMSWSSIRELRECAARHLGIPPEHWPFYEDVELERDLPLADARRKCVRLRTALASYAEEDLPDDYWLRFLARMLREGWDFCAMV
ncbi:hypothetical protein [Polyangium sp. y55x31]|uniref:hypothetical protein n=1 Tax=Polyangium sp. y55x31 TaxID=3042688 RepID=UPI002482318B|nr:hypothetical protein [Polyangium sp. y55x31]MDI1479285.1 hypothetical protein [Polyangium sp. y55x31]